MDVGLSDTRTRRLGAAVAFPSALIILVLAGLAVEVVAHPRETLQTDLLFWVLIVATVELLPVPGSPGLRLSLSFPILLAVALVYPPEIAALVAFAGSFDGKEIRREVSVLTALFNRSQIALSVFVGSTVFHSLANVRSPWYILVPGLFLAIASDYCVNVSLIALYMRLVRGIPLLRVLSQLRLGALPEFMLSYLGLGFMGFGVARLYLNVGKWSVAVFILPLVIARQMFFRSMALEEAGKELRDRERVLRALSNRMAEERQDERMQIAGYLHDDLAQRLFRLALQVDLAKKRLDQRDLDGVARDLNGIEHTKQETFDLVRALIRDLHRSPIGRAGLAEAIHSFVEDMKTDSTVRFSTEVAELSLPPPIQLLI